MLIVHLRDFTFSGLQLSSAAHHEGAVSEPVVAQSGAWPGAAGLKVERVAFLGLPKSNKGYSARLPGGEVRLMMLCIQSTMTQISTSMTHLG